MQFATSIRRLLARLLVGPIDSEDP